MIGEYEPYFYIVLESQLNAEGNFALLYNYYDNLDDALSKMYMVLSYAAKSTIPYHSGHIYRNDGWLMEGRVFDRRKAMSAEQENFIGL